MKESVAFGCIIRRYLPGVFPENMKPSGPSLQITEASDGPFSDWVLYLSSGEARLDFVTRGHDLPIGSACLSLLVQEPRGEH